MGAPLSVSHLSKAYRTHSGVLDAVSDVSFEVAAGECFCLLGPNGAGKSTTIQCISGFCPPTRGTVSLNGHDVHLEPKTAPCARGVCSQEETLDSDFSVLDQLVRHARYFRIARDEAQDRARLLLEEFGLADRARCSAAW